jgi:hypothetical protein
VKHIALLLALFTFPLTAIAEINRGDHRFSLSGGLIHISNPSQTSFAVSAEYEYRMDPFYGLGAQGTYVFSSSAITILSAPAFFLHPLQGNWYVSAAPVFYFGSSTQVGARFTTRMPLDMDILMLTPIFGVDIIKGGPNYIFGLGISI